MKTLFLSLVVLLTATVSEAASIKIYEDKPDGDHISASFAVNKDLGRAWVEVREVTYGDENSHDITTKVKVPGLSYDPELSAIVFEDEGRVVECANVVTSGRSIFRMTKIKNTNCSFSVEKLMMDIDDGFYIKRQLRVQVYLNVK
jgi:hypothetical protein